MGGRAFDSPYPTRRVAIRKQNAADEPLFLSKQGRRLHPDNFEKRRLKPLLDRLGLAGATHAFRHGKATAQDRLNAPMKVRQERPGHVSSRTTMNHTHWLEMTTESW